MTPEQLDIDIEELSTRMERVRSLYEQYFMGIERLEPTIPRKDVERRIQVLRKIRFQNTAKRFKFQTLIQRYNSLQQYWNRTCRDIENGTYKRHVQKAERRFGVKRPSQNPEKQNPDLDSLEADSLETAAEDQERPAGKAARAREQINHDLASLLDSDTDLNAEMNNVLAELERKPPQASRTEPKKDSAQPGDRATNATLLGRLGKSPEAGAPKEPGALTKTSPTPAGLKDLPPLKRPATSPEPLKPLPKTASGRSEPPRPTRRSERPPEAASGSNKPGLASKPPARPARPQTTPGLAGLPPRAIPMATASPALSTQPAPLPAAPLPRGAAPHSPTASPSPAAPPPRVPQPRTTTPNVVAHRPAPAAQAAPAPAAKAAPAPALRRSEPPRPRATQQLSEDRIKALHQSYVDARRQTNASGVSFEKLAKSLRDTEEKLRQKHAGRAIDFDVSIKDGKAILTPKLK